MTLSTIPWWGWTLIAIAGMFVLSAINNKYPFDKFFTPKKQLLFTAVGTIAIGLLLSIELAAGYFLVCLWLILAARGYL